MPSAHVTDLTGVSYCPQRQLSIRRGQPLVTMPTAYETVWETIEDHKSWTDRESDSD